MYAKLLTKDYLEHLGITEVSLDGKIYKGDTEIPQYLNNGGHYIVQLYDSVKRACTPAEDRTSHTGAIYLPVHRIVYTWYNKICPEGLVVDHRNNIKTDNRIENLQILTPGQNIWKDRAANVRLTKCMMNRPRSFYEEKLRQYEEQYESAKLNTDTKACHNLRSNIANTRARLRYWDEHKEEYQEPTKEVKKMTEEHKNLLELQYWKKVFREHGNKVMWRQCIKVEKLYKEDKENNKSILQHAIDVIHNTFGGK